MKVDAFAERVLRRSLWGHQAEAAMCQAFITVIAAARRTGKTSLIETLAIWTAFENAGCRVVILSATQDAARRITEGINDTLAHHPDLRGAVVDDFSTKIRLGNGSQIISLPASQKQVRGYGEGVLLLILDEAGFQPNEMWTAAQYVALDEKSNGSRIVLAGTPWGSSEAFFRKAFVAGEDGDPDYRSFHWDYTANPLLDHAYLERQRDRVSPIEFAAEIEGRWSDAAGALFSTELIEDQTIGIEMPTLAELVAGAARPSVGVDTGVSFDRSAIAAVYRLPGLSKLNASDDGRPKFVVLPYMWPQGARFSTVVEDVHGLPALVWNPETNGVGAGLSQQLEERLHGLPREKRFMNLVRTTAQSKTTGYSTMLGLAERGSLFWPRDPDFLRQLRGLKIEQRERGFASIENDPGIVQHDDLADAAMLAMAPRVTKKGRVICWLNHWANPRVARPDVELPDPPSDVVEAGSGYRVYRRAALQSVAGPGLQMPPSLAPIAEIAPPSSTVLAARAAIAAARRKGTS